MKVNPTRKGKVSLKVKTSRNTKFRISWYCRMTNQMTEKAMVKEREKVMRGHK